MELLAETADSETYLLGDQGKLSSAVRATHSATWYRGISRAGCARRCIDARGRRAEPALPRFAPHGGRPSLAALAAGVLLLASGCAEPRKYQPPHDPSALDDVLFLHYLATTPSVTVEEAARAMLVLADGEDRFDTYEARIAELEQRDVVRAAWGLQRDHNLDRGTLGFMLFRTCKLSDSVNSLLFGSWGLGDRRYALQRAAAAGLVEYGPDYQPVTGGEFVAALARADGYLADQNAYDSTERPIDSPADLKPAEPVN
jgi:hypothetical protein